MTLKHTYLNEEIEKCLTIRKKDPDNHFNEGKLFAYEDCRTKFNSPVITIDNSSLTNRELFLYIATSLAFSPLLNGIEKNVKTSILKKVCKEFENLDYISDKDVYEIFHAVEFLRTKLGLALNKHIDQKSLGIATENILSNPELIEQTIKQIQNNPELIKLVQKTLQEK